MDGFLTLSMLASATVLAAITIFLVFWLRELRDEKSSREVQREADEERGHAAGAPPHRRESSQIDGELGELTVGHFVMECRMADRGPLLYTLDQGDGPRTWQALPAHLLTQADFEYIDTNDSNSVRDIMLRNAVQRVQELQIPSLYVEDLYVDLRQRDGDLWMLAHGEVGFLESEWQRTKSKLQQAEIWYPPSK